MHLVRQALNCRFLAVGVLSPEAADASLKRPYEYLAPRRLASRCTTATTFSRAASGARPSAMFAVAAVAVVPTAQQPPCERRCASWCKAVIISSSASSDCAPRDPTKCSMTAMAAARSSRWVLTALAHEVFTNASAARCYAVCRVLRNAGMRSPSNQRNPHCWMAAEGRMGCLPPPPVPFAPWRLVGAAWVGLMWLQKTLHWRTER